MKLELKLKMTERRLSYGGVTVHQHMTGHVAPKKVLIIRRLTYGTCWYGCEMSVPI